MLNFVSSFLCKEKNNCHLREKWEFQNAGKKGKKIPESYATARYKDRWRDNEEEWVYQGFIVPRKIQEFLYEIMDDAFRNRKLTFFLSFVFVFCYFFLFWFFCFFVFFVFYVVI